MHNKPPIIPEPENTLVDPSLVNKGVPAFLRCPRGGNFSRQARGRSGAWPEIQWKLATSASAFNSCSRLPRVTVLSSADRAQTYSACFALMPRRLLLSCYSVPFLGLFFNRLFKNNTY